MEFIFHNSYAYEKIDKEKGTVCSPELDIYVMDKDL
jgi:hypothetical protein